MFSSLFCEKNLVFLKKSMRDIAGFKGGKEGVEDLETSTMAEDVEFATEYVKPITAIYKHVADGDWPRAWAVFYDTFLRDKEARSKTRKYMMLVGEKYNVLPKAAKIPLIGLIFKPSAFLLKSGLKAANLMLDKLGDIDGDKTFEDVSRKWDSLPPDVQAAFKETAYNMLATYEVLQERGFTQEEIERAMEDFNDEREGLKEERENKKAS